MEYLCISLNNIHGSLIIHKVSLITSYKIEKAVNTLAEGKHVMLRAKIYIGTSTEAYNEGSF